MAGLEFFRQMHSNGMKIPRYVLASYHPKWSITWSWSITWAPSWCFSFGSWIGRQYGDIRFGVPVLGELSVHWQPTMRRKP